MAETNTNETITITLSRTEAEELLERYEAAERDAEDDLELDGFIYSSDDTFAGIAATLIDLVETAYKEQRQNM